MNDSGEKIWRLTDDKLIRRMQITGKKEGIEVKPEILTSFYSTHTVFTFGDGLIYQENKETLAPIQDFLSCLPELPENAFYIDKSDISMFCRELLPLLEEHYARERINFDEAEYGVEPALFEIYLDAPQKDFITCKVYAFYGEKKFEVYKKDEERAGRDAVKEIRGKHRRFLL